MKAVSTYFLLALLPLVMSCNQTDNDSKNTLKSTDVLKKECYVAVDSLDTAKLNLDYLRSGDVTGTLVIDYADKRKNDGKLKGKFRGDTLFVDYTFKLSAKNPVVYKNPLALLKTDGKLILGVGQIETTLGRSYFVKNVPIDYRQVKFIFGAAECAVQPKP
ncbi:hypothetical protein [Pedobacter metabolipauper]|nr:hypothetical protein [Pedobacter metabolipauper]